MARTIEQKREERRLYMREYRASRPDTVREANFKASYGITLVEYMAMSEAQSGVCAICNSEETYTRSGKPRLLCVDHNHETGEVRALLCAKCNMALGLMEDDPALLDQAADYLRSYM